MRVAGDVPKVSDVFEEAPSRATLNQRSFDLMIGPHVEDWVARLNETPANSKGEIETQLTSSGRSSSRSDYKELDHHVERAKEHLHLLLREAGWDATVSLECRRDRGQDVRWASYGKAKSRTNYWRSDYTFRVTLRQRSSGETKPSADNPIPTPKCHSESLATQAKQEVEKRRGLVLDAIERVTERLHQTPPSRFGAVRQNVGIGERAYSGAGPFVPVGTKADNRAIAEELESLFKQCGWDSVSIHATRWGIRAKLRDSTIATALRNSADGTRAALSLEEGVRHEASGHEIPSPEVYLARRKEYLVSERSTLRRRLSEELQSAQTERDGKRYVSTFRPQGVPKRLVRTWMQELKTDYRKQGFGSVEVGVGSTWVSLEVRR
ncbi:MAG: hypothetical protein AAFQ82_09515 [Myxococcota bacterium]